MRTPIDELLERWRIETQRSSEDESLAWETFQQDKCREELSAAWTATKAQMVEREDAEALADALEILSECDLNDDNCASLEIASKRIRNMANRTLKAYRQSHPKPPDKTP